ncbi:uncharacterized protein FOBCDRAFT_215661 [Fusarium oxysporum Fo47]|uniref:uncharacterized protein n=1 Tax=Fusarium oxysporum Fo47 TaxID=660027 RepID=UPI0028698CDD|nr:uncharacterized protein FOBCDRAFT_215661 [Fusarium oxysporum Fo47]WJG34770.1 hypothetical protein FOBCDRAFT_215661 [Fusarium oxysporum Fo47]
MYVDNVIVMLFLTRNWSVLTDIEQGHKLPRQMTHYSGYHSIWNQHPDYPSPWVSYIVPSRFRGYGRVQRGPAWTL